jgi:hypothetical protein
VVEGAEEELSRMMGVYELMEGQVVCGRAVWQIAEGGEWFIFYTTCSSWFISTREHMETGNGDGFMSLDSTATALTPTQPRPSEVWQVDVNDNGRWVDEPGVQIRRQA